MAEGPLSRGPSRRSCKLVILTAEARGLTKSARSDARRRGFVPAVMYGKELDSTPIMVPAEQLKDAIRRGGRNQLFRLEGPAVDRPRTVLIKEMMFDEANSRIVHVDFFQPPAGRRIRLQVPLAFQGEEELARRGLILTHQMRTVEVECMPDHLPSAIAVDVSTAEPGQQIAVGDLHPPDGVEIKNNPAFVVLSIDVPIAAMLPPARPAVSPAAEVG